MNFYRDLDRMLDDLDTDLRAEEAWDKEDPDWRDKSRYPEHRDLIPEHEVRPDQRD